MFTDTNIEMHQMKKYRNVLVFDVETTGLIPKRDPITKKMPTLNEMPHIIQLSYIIYNIVDSQITKIYNSYIKLDENIKISEKITQLTGITQEKCDSSTVTINDALINFYNAYLSCDCIIAHNISFDSNMIKIEIERNYSKIEQRVPQILNLFNPIFEKIKNIETFCTMKESINICNILKVDSKDETKKYKKFPTLKELYETLFRSTPTNLHNSLMDVLVCLRCFLRIKIHQEIHEVKYNYMLNTVMNMI
jgi:DNA polymerase III alpha subunit (gram-positive type)